MQHVRDCEVALERSNLDVRAQFRGDVDGLSRGECAAPAL